MLVLASFVHVWFVAQACVKPQGILDDYPGSLTQAEVDRLPKSVEEEISRVSNYPPHVEAPIEIRIAAISRLAAYNLGAAYHNASLDFFARTEVSDDRRRCLDGDPELLELHRVVSMLFVWAYSRGRVEYEFTLHKPEELRAIVGEWGLDFDRCPSGPGCDDISTPWGFARVLGDEILDYGTRDGWNSDGSLSHHYNRIAYEDWRTVPYAPFNDAHSIRDMRRWQPLKEHNTIGFVFFQSHVTPHIGETGKSMLLGDEFICGLQTPDPHYDLEVEARNAVSRSASLTADQKARIEFFDSKVPSVLGTAHEFIRAMGRGLTDWEGLEVSAMVAIAMYEATITIWREKVFHDLVRPSTVVRKMLGEEEFDGYLGNDIGTAGKIKGRDWQPYIRVMPHSEYPSGSGCLCAAFAGAMTVYSGSDSVKEALDIARAKGWPTPETDHLVTAINPNSSNRETAQPPPIDYTFKTTSWKQLAEECGQSRIDGGMHFPRAVQESLKLCYPIGERVGQAFVDLRQRKTPAYVVDIKSKLPQEVRCTDKKWERYTARQHRFLKRQQKEAKKMDLLESDGSSLLQHVQPVPRGDSSLCMEDENEEAVEDVPM